MLHIFPDTNVFIHGKHFEEIDWTKIFGTDDLTLVLAPMVITELDKHKYHANARIGRRVKKLLVRLEAIIEGGPSTYLVSVVLKNPSEQAFAVYNLDKNIQDDQFLASIMEFSLNLDPGDSVYLVSNDTGLRLKARSLSLPTIKLPEASMHVPEPDESEKKIYALQKELNQYKNQVPDIILCFENEEFYFTIERPQLPKSQTEYLEQELAKIKDEYHPLIFNDSDTISVPGMTSLRIPIPFKLTLEQINTYNAELEKFYKSYADYLIKTFNRFLFKYNCVKVQLVLKNSGFVPANDLDIELHFPDGFDMIEQEDFPKSLKKPSPPYKPKNALDFGSRISLYDLITPIYPGALPGQTVSKRELNVSQPRIKRTNSYDVSFHVRNVKHNQSVLLDGLYLKFPDITAAKGFSIDYKILAGNIPLPVTGRLNVDFKNYSTPT